MKRRISIFTLAGMLVLGICFSVTVSAARCTICFGDGRNDCMICHGTGRATSFSIAPSGMDQFAVCQGCSGRGWNHCAVCNGSGEIPDNNSSVNNNSNIVSNNSGVPSTGSISDFEINNSDKRLIRYKGSSPVVTIPDTVEIIGIDAFIIPAASIYNDNSPAFYITDVYIPSSVKRISNSAFRGCSKLENVTIEPGVTTIDNAAFWRCNSLESIVIPSTVTHMGASVFSECTKLKSVFIPPNVTSFKYDGGNMFMDCQKGLTVYGEPGSEIEKYAKFQGVSFEPYYFYFDLYEAGAVKTVEAAIQKAGLPLVGKPNATINQSTVTVSFSNAGKIPTEVINAINNAAKKAKVNLKLVVDTKGTDGKLFSRITVDPALVKGGINLSALSTDTMSVNAKSIINMYYKNNIMAVNIDENVNVNQSMRIVVKNNAKLKTNQLKFYTYDFETNTTTPVNTKYTADKNGFIHFKSDAGGVIIISDGALQDK